MNYKKGLANVVLSATSALAISGCSSDGWYPITGSKDSCNDNYESTIGKKANEDYHDRSCGPDYRVISSDDQIFRKE